MGLQPPSQKVTSRVPQLFVPRRTRWTGSSRLGSNGFEFEGSYSEMAASLFRGRQRMLCFVNFKSGRDKILCRAPFFPKDIMRFSTMNSHARVSNITPAFYKYAGQSILPTVAETIQEDGEDSNSVPSKSDENDPQDFWRLETEKQKQEKLSLQICQHYFKAETNSDAVNGNLSGSAPAGKMNPPNQVKSLQGVDEKNISSNGSFSSKSCYETDNSLLSSTLALESRESERERDEDGSSYGVSQHNFAETEQKEQKQKEMRDQMNKEKLKKLYEKVLIVDTISEARKVVHLLTTKHKNLIHACDTEVSEIDVKEETPVGHGKIICLSIYSGNQVDYGNGKSCIWVDVLDGENNILMEFAPFFENPAIRKVWHNYSFDSHIIRNYGINICGFHADTMHLARLWDSSRRTDGGYSLEALTGNSNVMKRSKQSTSDDDDLTTGKISMKTLFGKKKIKKDGTEGKLIFIASVETLQREERVPWICYSALDSISTLKLFESLREKLMARQWTIDGSIKGRMFDFYNEYWRPFGELLTKMESHGMLVDRNYLAEVEKVAISEQRVAADAFRKWASLYCADAKYMNVGSDTQIRQLFFGGIQNKKDPNQTLPIEKTFKVPNTEKIIEEGKKAPLKNREITLSRICEMNDVEMCTPSGWPSVSGDALKILAGKVSFNDFQTFDLSSTSPSNAYSGSGRVNDTSVYGLAFNAFNGGTEGAGACRAIAALCEMCSIDSLISNFIIPLQGNHIAGHGGRIHCSLNINTETGRLSARRPNLQNQPALEKDRYKIRQAFIAAPGNSLIVADYGQLELRILAHLANCKSMLDAFEAGGDFHSRTAMNMYYHVRQAVNEQRVLLEWHPQPGIEKPPVPLLKDAFAAERRKAKMLNFSIAYGKTPVGLARDWKVSVKEAKETVDLWYNDRKEVLKWQEERKKEARQRRCVHTLLGRARHFPSMDSVSNAQKGHIERAAINTPVQGSAADVAMCAMLEIAKNKRLKELGWRLLLQVHDEVILEGPTRSAEEAKSIVVDCMSKPFNGKNTLRVELSVDAKCAPNWYAGK